MSKSEARKHQVSAGGLRISDFGFHSDFGFRISDMVVHSGRLPAFSREGAGFRVSGRLIERLVAEADLEDEDAVELLQKRLIREGVEKALKDAGARLGDDVSIGSVSFEFIPEGE